MACKREQWSDDSTAAAVDSVLKENKELRKAANLYNVPIKTLRRCVNGSVKLDCKPGPATVLTEEEEDKLAEYLIKMSEMGFSLTKEGVMGMAFSSVSVVLTRANASTLLRMVVLEGHGLKDLTGVIHS